jgi:hypothetical protein
MNRIIKNPFARMLTVAVATLCVVNNLNFIKFKKNNFMIPMCVCLLCLSCGNKSEADRNGQSLEAIGMIEYTLPEDNCGAYMFVIQYENPDHFRLYKPDKLPDKFKTDKLQVKVTYRETEKKHHCGFGGDVPVIEIITIEKIEQ